MKKILLMLATLPFAGFAQQNYTINGKVDKVTLPATAYVVYQESGTMKNDSATVQKDGSFVLKGTVSIPMKAFLMVSQNGEKLNSKPSPDQIGLYLENGITEVYSPDSLYKARLSGTPLNNDQQEMMTLLGPFKKTEAAMNTGFKKAEGNAAEEAQIQAAYESMQRAKLQITEGFILAHPNSLVSLSLLRSSFNPDQHTGKAEAIFNKLSPALQTSRFGQSYLGLIGKAKLLAVGGTAPDFTLRNTKDENVSLSSYRGKYVLIDFWASWCVPCRKENPNVLKAYEKYKNKNFTILGISLDGGTNAKQNWLSAIEKDGLPWEQLSDLKGWASDAAQLYHISAIPANFLIDPTGKIIGKDLRGDALEEKLATIKF